MQSNLYSFFLSKRIYAYVINNRKAHKCFEFKHFKYRYKYYAFKVRYKRCHESFN